MSVDLAASFSREVRNALHLFGAWPPGEVKAVGTYGVLDGAWFRPIGNIANAFGIVAQPRPTGPKLQFDFKSSGATEVVVDVSADGAAAAGAAKIKTKLSFKHAGSSYFRTKNAVYRTIGNLEDVNRQIMAAFAVGNWRGDYALIHGVFEADSTTIIISSEDNAEIELEGAASPGGALDLADAHAEVKYKSDRNIATKILCGPHLTPLICLSRIVPRNRFLNLLGLSEKHILPLLQNTGAPGVAASDNFITQLAPDISTENLKDLGMKPDEMYHMVEI